MAKFTSIRQAKQKLLEHYSHEPWFRGDGIGVNHQLRLNVAPGHAEGLPKTFEGYELKIVEINRIVAQ